MKKSTSFNKSKLMSYSAVAGAIVAGNAIDAQVTYMDINPDVVVDSLNPYQMDFNNDQTPDLVLGVQHIAGSGTGFTYIGQLAYAYAPTAKFVTTVDTLTNAAALDCGVAISSASVIGTGNTGIFGYAALINGTQQFTSNSQTPGTTPFLGATDKYLGLSFTAGANTHYAWIKLSVSADAKTITVKEYAFNATAGASINTCQTSGLENVSVEDKVTIKTTLNDATINVTSDLIGGKVSLVSMSGQVVKTISISDVNTTISFDGVDTGIYTVNAKFDGGSVNKRVYVK